ncbi:MAG: NAD(P)-dependent oxidoreductase [Chitinophagaceae bacterium]|jgi:dTDP-6-deoxy-L-talose 4-dehydrogenase (NAD+)|nr:NAD(P)-dependent oxidoreductase [Chitinophagaceae bacterium]
MKKILITGASGFIGHHVIKYLIAHYKHEFSIITTSSNKEKVKDAEWFKLVDYIPFDLSKINSSENYFKYFNKPDILIHLAWEGLPNYKSLFHFEENLPRHYTFIKNLVQHGLSDITITGTCFEYGMQKGCLIESLPSQPANPYALAKDALYKFLDELKKQHPFAFKWIRLFYMYGEGQNPNSLFSQLDKALEKGDGIFNMSGGEQIRDYLPVEKVAEHIVKITIQQQVQGIINSGSGCPVTIKKMIEDYLSKKNKSIKLNTGFYPYNDFEPMNFWADITKLNTILNK